LQEAFARQQGEAADPGQRLLAGNPLGIEHLAVELGNPARFADLLQQGGWQGRAARSGTCLSCAMVFSGARRSGYWPSTADSLSNLTASLAP
jgi:hypothetical protein